MIISIHGIISSSIPKGGEPPVQAFLTIVVNGLDEDYQVVVNGVEWVDHKKEFPIGTVLENLRVRVEDYDLDPTFVDQVIIDSNKTLTFEATSQGFSHLDDEWEDDNGGHLESNLTRTGNSLFIVPSSVNNHIAWAGAEMFMADGNASLKFELHEGMIGVLKDGESVGGQNNFAYGVKTDGAQIVATTWLGDPANDNYIPLAGYTHPIIIEMEFTPTEVVWYHGDGVDRLEWFRYERLDFDYYVGAEVYTSIENIKQKGFTTSTVPSPLLDGFSYIDLPSDKWTEDPANVYTQIVGGDLQDLPFEIIDDGVILYRYAAANVGNYVPDMYLKSPSEPFIDFWIEGDGDVIYYVEGGATGTATTAVVGTYYGYRKVSGNVDLVSTTDGVTFTSLYDYGSRSTYDQLATWYSSDGPWSYIQGVGVTPIDVPLTILPDAAYMNFNSTNVIEDPSYIYTADGEVRSMIPLYLPGEGIIAVKYATGNLGEMMLTETNDVEDDYVGFYFDSGNLYYEIKSGGSGLAAAMTEDMFAVLRKTSTNILLQTTEDGVTFDTVHDFGALTYSYVRLYGPNGYKWNYPQGIEIEAVESYDVLLDDATRLVLDPTAFTKVGNVYTGNELAEAGLTLNYTMEGDGFIGVRRELDQNCTFYLENGTGGYAGFYAEGNEIWYESDASGPIELTSMPAEHEYFGLRRVSGAIGLYSTTDGTSYTLLQSIITGADYNNITYGGLSGTTIKFYDPQGVGLTNT